MIRLTLENLTNKIAFLGVRCVDWEFAVSVLKRFVGDNRCSMIFDPLWKVSMAIWTKRSVVPTRQSTSILHHLRIALSAARGLT